MPAEPTNDALTNFVSQLISKAYPDQSVPTNSGVPLYMPLKISFYGGRLAGKSTLSAKVSEKYGIPIIDPSELLK